MSTDTKKPYQPTGSEKNLIQKLRQGQEWLTQQHDYWLQEYTVAVDDETYSAQLAAWDEHERILRITGFKGCIWQPIGRCDTKAPVKCWGCVKEQPGFW